MNKRRKPPVPYDLLITGCERSGTTLLTSLLSYGGQVVGVNEDYEGRTKVLTDKKLALKAPMPRMDFTKSSSYGEIQIWRKLNKYRNKLGLMPKKGVYRYSIMDFIEQGKPVFMVYRLEEDNIQSMMRRSGYSRRIATKVLKEVIATSSYIYKNYPKYTYWISLFDLIDDTENTLKTMCRILQIDYTPKMLEGWKINLYTEYKGIVGRAKA